MAEDFNIRPGRYVVPNIGTVNTRTGLTDDVKVKLYLSKAFPFITLQPEGVKVLKKAKLTNEQIGSLILQAKSKEELDLVVKIRSNKVIRRIAEYAARKFET